MCRALTQASVLWNHAKSLAKLVIASHASPHYASHSDDENFSPRRSSVHGISADLPARMKDRGELLAVGWAG